jgi:hypothetical protein
MNTVPLLPGWLASLWLIVGLVVVVAFAAGAVPGNAENDACWLDDPDVTVAELVDPDA